MHMRLKSNAFFSFQSGRTSIVIIDMFCIFQERGGQRDNATLQGSK